MPPIISYHRTMNHHSCLFKSSGHTLHLWQDPARMLSAALPRGRSTDLHAFSEGEMKKSWKRLTSTTRMSWLAVAQSDANKNERQVGPHFRFHMHPPCQHLKFVHRRSLQEGAWIQDFFSRLNLSPSEHPLFPRHPKCNEHDLRTSAADVSFFLHPMRFGWGSPGSSWKA